MEKNLKKFYEKIENVGSKDIVAYQDEKGNYALLPISQLFLSCEFVQLDEAQLKMAIFNGTVAKNMEFEKETITRAKDKSEVTNNKKDQGTVVESEVEVSNVWIVRNGLGLTESFNSQNEALLYVSKKNNYFMQLAELI